MSKQRKDDYLIGRLLSMNTPKHILFSLAPLSNLLPLVTTNLFHLADKLLRRDHFDNELSCCRIDTTLRGNRRIACTGEGFRERYPPFNKRKDRTSEQA
jgi:hypothetical protein